LETITILGLFLLAYLIGSIPTAVWWGKRFYGIDIREFGSGNAGATNTFRILGKNAGIPVLCIDVIKGTIAVLLAHFSYFLIGSNEFINLELGLGMTALLGHVFPVFAGFRGGKGVATVLGVVICVVPAASCLALCVFLMVLFSTRYVSLSSIMAGLSFPFFLNFVCNNQNQILLFFSVFVAALLILTHKKNISRLLNREESKINLFTKKI
jgi:glycerol-3-phosphate acyltransferase PlsY